MSCVQKLNLVSNNIFSSKIYLYIVMSVALLGAHQLMVMMTMLGRELFYLIFTPMSGNFHSVCAMLPPSKLLVRAKYVRQRANDVGIILGIIAKLSPSSSFS